MGPEEHRVERRKERRVWVNESVAKRKWLKWSKRRRKTETRKRYKTLELWIGLLGAQRSIV